MTLLILDYGLYFLHLAFTVFIVLGWIPRVTRRVHRWCVAITATCWLGVGVVVGRIGYCPMVDWHWQIKRLRGESELPSSFITYIAHQVGFYPDPTHVDIGVGVTFAAIVVLTIALWWKERAATVILKE